MSSFDSSPRIGLASPIVVRAPFQTPANAAPRAPASPVQPQTPQAAHLQATPLFQSPSPLALLPSPPHPLRSYALPPAPRAAAVTDAMAPPMVRAPATSPRLGSPIRLAADVVQVPAWPSSPYAFRAAFSPPASPAGDLTARFAAMTAAEPTTPGMDVAASPPWHAYTLDADADEQGRVVRHPAVLNGVTRAESRALLRYVDAWLATFEDFWPKRHEVVGLRDRLAGTAGLLGELREAMAERRRSQWVLRPTAAVLRQAEAEASRVPAFGAYNGWVARSRLPQQAQALGLGLFGVSGLPQEDGRRGCYASHDDDDVALEGCLERLSSTARRWNDCPLDVTDSYTLFLAQLHNQVVASRDVLEAYLSEHPL